MRKFRNALMIMGIFFVFAAQVFSQNQPLADSLENEYELGRIRNTEKLKILETIAFSQTDVDKILKYSEELIKIAKAQKSPLYLQSGYLQKGNAYRQKGDLDLALKNYFIAAKIASENNFEYQFGTINSSIADVYVAQGNYKNAIYYHKKAIGILRKSNSRKNLPSALLNLGDAYINNNILDSAEVYTLEAFDLYQNINSQIGIAYSKGNLGIINAKNGENAKAETNIKEAIAILEELGDYYPISVYLTYMYDLYKEKGDTPQALKYLNESLEIAQKYQLKNQISDAHLKLSEHFASKGDIEKAYGHYKSHITYRDSVSNLQTVQKLADLRTDFEVSQKQGEVNVLELEKRNHQLTNVAALIASALLLIIAVVWYRRYRFIKKAEKNLKEERDKSDQLLLNILPEETAAELKQFGKVEAKRFDSVSVLFTDFKGFTSYADNLSPEKLVETVNFYFSKFDEIIEKYDLEKIKTIGDAYMCAGGLPFPDKDHPTKIIEAAFEIAEFVENTKLNASSNDVNLGIRLGINTGPVVAGVVGSKKFAYDIWGDAVNIASRMESNSESGRINISENTYQIVKDKYNCEYRGELSVKNKGKMKMYFINGRK